MLSKMSMFKKQWKTLGFSNFLDLRMGSRWLQDRSKTGPRAIKKTMHFSTGFFTRLGVVLGSFWGSKRSPNRFHRLHWSDPGRSGSRSGCLSPFQEGKANDGQASDRCKRASGGGLGPSGVLGLFGGLLGADPPPGRHCRTRHFPRTASMG